MILKSLLISYLFTMKKEKTIAISVNLLSDENVFTSNESSVYNVEITPFDKRVTETFLSIKSVKEFSSFRKGISFIFERNFETQTVTQSIYVTRTLQRK